MGDDLRENRRQILQESRTEQRYRLANDKRADVQSLQDDSSMTSDDFSRLLGTLKNRKKDKYLLQRVKNGLSVGEDYIKAFLLSQGALDCLVSVLVGNDVACQVQAIGCVANLCCGSHKATLRALKATAPYLVTFLGGDNLILQDCSLRALGNMAVDGDRCCELLDTMGFVHAAVKLLKSPHPEVIESCVCCLQRYTRNAAMTSRDVEISGMLGELTRLLGERETCPSVSAQVARAIFNICARTDAGNVGSPAPTAVCRKILEQYVKQVGEPEPDVTVLTPLQRSLAALTACSGELAEQVAKHNELEMCLCTAMASQYLHIRRECLWLLSNIAGSGAMPSLSTQSVGAIFDSSLPLLVAGSPGSEEVGSFLRNIVPQVPQFGGAVGRDAIRTVQ